MFNNLISTQIKHVDRWAVKIRFQCMPTVTNEQKNQATDHTINLIIYHMTNGQKYSFFIALLYSKLCFEFDINVCACLCSFSKRFMSKAVAGSIFFFFFFYKKKSISFVDFSLFISASKFETT